VTLDLKKFQTQPLPVRIELIRRSLNYFDCGQRSMTRHHYERIVQLAEQNISGRKIELPGGILVQREYGDMIFSRDRGRDCRGRPVCLPRVTIQACPYVQIPGKTKFGKYLIEATICEVGKDEFKSADPLFCHFDRGSTVGGPKWRNLVTSKQRGSRAAGYYDYARYDEKCHIERFDMEKLKLPLRVRHRRPGDRFAPLGLDGEKKIGKFLTAQRIPHEVRKKVVLVEDREKIIWVWPVRISERAKVTAETGQILRLQITNRVDATAVVE
jgi:tRNA(Ile)-lysidine synthase